MGRSIAVLLFMLPLVIFSSCKKRSTTLQLDLMYIPNDLDSLFFNHAYIPQRAMLTDVSGVLVANDLSGMLTDTGGTVIPYSRKWEAALFLNNRTSMALASAGTVSINAVPLQLPFLNFTYVLYDTAAVWQDDSINHWQVSGAGDIASFSATIDGTIPSYSGALPTSFSKGRDYAITFNSANTQNADQAYVILYYYGTTYATEIVSTNGGTVILPARLFEKATNQYLSIPQRVGPTIYYGGLICVVIYSQSIQTINGKRYAFVKQKEVLGVVNFL